MSTKKLAFATIVYALGTILEPVLVGMPVVSAVANSTLYCTNLVLLYAQVPTESDIPDEKGQMGRLSESSCRVW